MYAGAAYALIYAIGFSVVVGHFLKDHPYDTAAHASLGGLAVATVVVSVIEIVLWIWIARACQNRRSWARVAGTVLFAIHTLGLLDILARSQPALAPAKVLTVIGWLIACGAVVFLWQRASSLFFRATA
jgi:hypothetical protein